MKRIVVLFAIGILIVSILSGRSAKEESTTDVSLYGNFSTFQRRGALLVFPKAIPKNAIVNGYYYSQVIPPFIGTYYQIYLNITLPEDEYELEVNRLSRIKKGTKVEMYDKSTLSDIRLDKNNFIYPAYVTMVGYNGTSEYALLNKKEHKIIYVFVQIISENNIKFDREYLPKGYKNSGDCNESFSIYP
jgi:hypothetical protein